MEILASLVILGIVFVAFMTIFPQMTLFNSRTEAKLETMNEARVILEEYREEKWKEKTLAPSRFTAQGDWWKETEPKNPNATILIKKLPDEGPPLGQELKPGMTRLHKITIEVNDKGKLSSRSFGYIQVK